MRSIPSPLTRVLLAAATLIVAASTSDSQAVRRTIEGRVFNADRTPAPNVYVIAWEAPDARGLYLANPVATGVTDAGGRYRLSGVSQGRYKVFANADWFDASNPSSLDFLPVVAVRSGVQAVHNIDLPPRPQGVTVRGQVSGDVLDTSLQSISLNSIAGSFRTEVDFDGSFAFRNVPPGSYAVTSTQSPRPFLWTSREVHVADRDITELELSPPGLLLPVLGRVVVEGGGPAPSFTFALEGAQGFAHSAWIWVTHSVRSGPMISVSGWAERHDDVIFNASLPTGLYRIALSGLPSGNTLFIPINPARWTMELMKR